MTDKLCERPGYRHLTWFPEQPDLKEKTELVIAICNVCPVRAACLRDARARRETYGEWGGVEFDMNRKRVAA